MVTLSLPGDGIGLSLAEIWEHRGNCLGVALPLFRYGEHLVRVSSIVDGRAIIWRITGKRHQTWIPWSLTADPRELICISRWPPVTELASRGEVGRIGSNLRFATCRNCGMTFLRIRAGDYCTQVCRHRHAKKGKGQAVSRHL